MGWPGALRSFSRWATVSLAGSLVLWPCLALAALLFCQRRASHGVTYWLGTPLALAIVCGFTVLMSIAGGLALLRSSLPGGRGIAVPRPAGYKPPNALPPLDPALFSTLKWLLGTLFSWLFVSIVSSLALIDFDDDVQHFLHFGLFPILLLAVGVVACIALGQIQSLRNPRRVAPAYLAMLTLQGSFSVGRMAWLLLKNSQTGHGLSGLTKLALLGVVVQLGFDAILYRRLQQRALSYR